MNRPCLWTVLDGVPGVPDATGGDDDGPNRGIAPAAQLFRALSDPGRLTILGHLMLGEHSVRDLTEHLGLSQSTVSAHLACLRGCGLVRSRPVRRTSLHSLAVTPELLALLRAAEEVLRASGSAVVLCPGPGERR